MDTTKIHLYESKNKNQVDPSPNPEILPKHPFRVVMSGASGAGKTNVILNFINDKYLGYFDLILLYSPTVFIDDAWDSAFNKRTLKRKNCFDNPTPEDIENIFQLQSKIVEEHGIHKSPKILLIMDDIIDNQQFLRSKIMGALVFRSRHINISMIVSTQVYNKIPRSVRINFSDTFLFKPTLSELNVLVDNCCPANLTKKQFKGLINHATEDAYQFCHISHKSHHSEMIRKGLGTALNINI